MSNLRSKQENHVFVYDNLGLPPDENFHHNVAAIFSFQAASKFEVYWPNMKRQEDGSSCEVYCAAFRASACYDQEPDKLGGQFDHKASFTC